MLLINNLYPERRYSWKYLPHFCLKHCIQLLVEAGSYTVEADIVSGQPCTVISEAVEHEGIDLLVMGAYGHSRIRNLIIGSTTTEMVRSCKIPVILYR